MPNFLADPTVTLQLVFVMAFVAAVFFWYRFRSKLSIALCVVSLMLLVGLLVCSLSFQSGREQAIERANGVVDALNRYDSNSVLPHISDQFDYQGCKKKQLANAELNKLLRSHQAKIQLWGFSREDVAYSSDGNSCTISFGANVSGDAGSRPGFFVKMTTVKESDGKFRIKGFKVYENALQQTNSSEFIVPGMR